MLRTKTGRYLALLLGGAMLLAACSTASTKNANNGASGPGGTLVIGTTDAPSLLYSGVLSGIGVNLPSTKLFASPVRYTNSFKPLPYLAKSWSFSSDKLHLTLNLVHNATFSNGTPITSKDVAFSVGVVRKYHPFGRDLFGDVTSVSTPNKYTAVLNLAKPDPAIMIALDPNFLPVLPESVYGNVSNLPADPRLKQNVVGSGPYRLQSFVPGQKVVLVARKNFFMKGYPKLHEIIIQDYQSATSEILALKDHEIDLASTAGPSELKSLASAKGIKVANAGFEGLGTIIWMEYNLKNPYLSNLKVRQAIAYAVDDNYLIKDLNDGYPKYAPGPIAPGSPYFDANVTKYQYNPAKARQLLNAAGYPVKSGGSRFTLTLTYDPGGAATYGVDLAQTIKSELAKVGINAVIQTYPDEPSWEKAASNYQWDLDIDNVWNWGDPSIGVARTYLCNNIRKGVVWDNMERYCNPTVDTLFTQAEAAPSQTQAKALYGRIQQIITSQLPIDYFMTWPLRNAYWSSLKNPPNGIWGTMSPMLSTTVGS